jgi:lipopolysaccharide transport system ATP-binding protein
MSILGLSKEEIDERFEEVVAFAEIGEAIDAPVQSYSSGMAARLGFASAIFTEPEILLIDEVLAVGDIKFRVKCYRKLAQLRQKGVTFILVSHSPQSILSVCESAVYLQKGKLVQRGSTDVVLSAYEQDLFLTEKDKQSFGILKLQRKEKCQEVDLLSLCFKDNMGNALNHIESGKPTYLSVIFEVNSQINDINFSFLVKEIQGENDSILYISSIDDQEIFNFSPGRYELKLKMPYVGLKPGIYTIKFHISKGKIFIIDYVESFIFRVKSSVMKQCLFYQPRAWNIHECRMTDD